MTLRRPAGILEHRLMGHGLTSSQIFWLALTSRLTVNLALLPSLTASRAGRDAWLSFLVSIPAGLAFAWVGTYLPRLAPGSGLAEQGRRALGPLGGLIVTLLYVWSYMHLTSLIVRDYAEVIVTAVLPNTPLEVVVAVVALLAAVMAAQDTPTVGRLALILGPLVLLAVVSVLAPVSPQAELARLTPVFETGWPGVASGALSATAWHSLAYFYPAVAPSVVDPVRGRRALLGGLAAATLMSAFLAAEVLAVMSAELAVQTQFPLFELARLVMIGEFFQRVDALAIAAWGLGLLIGAALYLHSAVLSLSDLVNLADHRRLVKPVALLIAVGAVVAAGSASELKQFSDARVLVPYVAGHVWVPTAVWAVAGWLRGLGARQPLQGREG